LIFRFDPGISRASPEGSLFNNYLDRESSRKLAYTMITEIGRTEAVQNKASNKMTAESARRSYQPIRSAIISIGVVVFLAAFRPFGLAIDSVADALVLLGVAPLNFLIMLGIHAFPLGKEPWRTVVALGCLVAGNTAYLAAWSQSARALETGFSVALVVGLTAVIVFLWNRGRIPEQEFHERHVDAGSGGRSITLSGEGDREVLQMAADELLFISANGNYVDVHYRTGKGVAKSMLRSSLAGLAAQVPGTLLVQCHRSYFVNMVTARRIVRSKGRTLIEFDGGERVPVSRKFRQNVLEAISA